ncbi:MAG: translation elongation factor 4 [Acidimicrobiia bacterium]|nr:translation elongation factor 4 [Acidimicrobiia bacterium]MDH5504662.1 translation elongation factor 4 [Acidimicrobiia bacterium]
MSEYIRNLSIIAHIDHGKSTLADRLMEHTGAVTEREMREQLLDTMDLERERGITIKAQSVRLSHEYQGHDYQINLIDTPGHVDFSYEVSRSLAACDGAVLLVDAAQGAQAQTLANAYLAIEAGLEIVPVINKIDLPSADPAAASAEIAAILGGDPEDVLAVSAKTGQGISELLDRIIERIPKPSGDLDAPLRALVFDSYFDTYRGVVCSIRVVDGRIRKGEQVLFMATGDKHAANELAVSTPRILPVDQLNAGEVGLLITGVKHIDQIRVGDTVTLVSRPASEPLEGYDEPKPMVFSGLFPSDGDDFERLREALEKLQLNDASLIWEPETSRALGFGFRVGFLGLLHMEIVRERLEREYNLDLVSTAPSVAYRVTLTDDSVIEIRSPQDLPHLTSVAQLEEPYVRAMILSPSEYIGTIMDLVQSRRGAMHHMQYLTPDRVELIYELPLAEVVFDFFDHLKSRTRGYASLDYEPTGYRVSDLVKVDILLAGLPVDAFSTITHRAKAVQYGKGMVETLRELIPRQMFDVPIQAAIGGNIISRETVKARRKDVLAKCYGGDISRKRKLLEKQKEGKKRMKMVGAVEVPQEAFVAALRVDTSDR